MQACISLCARHAAGLVSDVLPQLTRVLLWQRCPRYCQRLTLRTSGITAVQRPLWFRDEWMNERPLHPSSCVLLSHTASPIGLASCQDGSSFSQILIDNESMSFFPSTCRCLPTMQTGLQDARPVWAQPQEICDELCQHCAQSGR
jgi:hypothetical protein